VYWLIKKLNQAQVEHLLKQLNAKHIVFGHTSLDQVETRHNNQVIAIDTSIKKGEKGEILLWQDQRFLSGDMLGAQSRLF
jgi:tRNA(Ile)-lysidine synthase TilS/MesJ